MYLLEIIGQHEFDNLYHESLHATYDGAAKHGELMRAEIATKDDPEWDRFFVVEIRKIEVVA